jgi:DNA-binding GntR family transcriptional regulator
VSNVYRTQDAVNVDVAVKVAPHTELPLTFAEHVRALLELEITEGRLAPGRRLREVELAELLGVSRTPVREALRVLERDGLVVRDRGKGTFVSAPLDPAEVLTLYAARCVIEPFLAGRAAAEHDGGAVALLESAQREFRQIAGRANRRTADIQRLLTLDTKIHMTMYGEAHSPLTNVVESYWARTVRERSFLYSSAGRTTLMEFSAAHDAIIVAFAERRAEQTSELVLRHLESGVTVLRSRLDGSAPG